MTFWKSTMTLGCALPFAINVTHYVSMTVEVTCFLFHSLTFLLSDSRHPVKQALFHALSCFLSVRMKDLVPWDQNFRISFFTCSGTLWLSYLPSQISVRYERQISRPPLFDHVSEVHLKARCDFKESDPQREVPVCSH